MGLSGKCDFQDTIEIFGDDKIINDYNIYVNDFILPLRIESKKDLIALYPFIISSMWSDNKTGGKINIGFSSFIDEEESEWLQYKLDRVIRYWKKCKRKKIPFDEEEAYKKICFGNFPPQKHEIEIVKRVKEFGDKATIYDIHDSTHDYIREEWYKLMIEFGWDEKVAYRWVYGWHRFFSKYYNITNKENEK